MFLASSEGYDNLISKHLVEQNTPPHLKCCTSDSYTFLVFTAYSIYDCT